MPPGRLAKREGLGAMAMGAEREIALGIDMLKCVQPRRIVKTSRSRKGRR